VGILLGFIPHKYHSLRQILCGVEEGTIPHSEATADMKMKWAAQIRQSVAQLHSMGILWCDIKTDNVLINDDSDAVVLDFGGGNTIGWVDRDKFGTLEGDLQGLDKILKALGQK
jgi:serine/threonine protein kinase